ncbi:MAG TPA: TIGR04282 family arsenosugar biosynthesis glycosyltransferase [Candidatus Krumholzibacteria bacterium]|nr:TIGR04282 family arsenosugar biosynthesis glycosyltransferase [Candidatus Krumholzibacteria bacterium]
MTSPIDACLGIFAKAPRPGTAKTRLIPLLGPDGAASLYEAFVEDTVNLALGSAARHCRLWLDGSGPETYASAPFRVTLRQAQRSGRLDRSPQSAGDLGDRLSAAVDEADGRGELPLLIVGTDSPDLPAGHLGSALDALAHGADLVLGSAADGGVWCIGVGRRVPGLFDALPWSSPRTGEALRNRADALGLERSETRGWFDVDTPDDLRSLVTRLREHPGRAKITRDWLVRCDRPELDPRPGIDLPES